MSTGVLGVGELGRDLAGEGTSFRKKDLLFPLSPPLPSPDPTPLDFYSLTPFASFYGPDLSK